MQAIIGNGVKFALHCRHFPYDQHHCVALDVPRLFAEVQSVVETGRSDAEDSCIRQSTDGNVLS